MNRWLLWFSVIVVAGSAWWVWSRYGPPDPGRMYVFNGVRGPVERSIVVQPAASHVEDFASTDVHRVAILVTDQTAGWLGLARGFRSQGIPFAMTTDPDEAMKHKVMVIYPILSGRIKGGGQTLTKLGAFIRSGGTLLTFDQAGGGLEELFGAGDGVESRTRYLINWTQPQGAARENTISVNHTGESNMGTIGYIHPKSADVIASYDDGTAALTCHTVVGKACLLGVDLGALTERSMNGRGESIGRDYINGYEPSLDMLYRWVRDLYVAGEPMPWLISTVPHGKDVSIIWTHDIDFTRSVVNSPAYAQVEQAHGVKATYFIQAKYMKDWNDDIFFNDKTVPIMRQLKDEGMELASHTVAHSRIFKGFDMGDGKELYPKYRPFVIDQMHARNGTVLGEARVPKFLLEHETGAEVVSFRPGHLSYPPGLPQALAAADYAYSSSLPSESALSNLPYQTTYDRADSALEPVYEFPVTIEDEQTPRLDQRLNQSDQLVAAIAKNHGTVVIMIHPDVTGYKLGFEKALMDRWTGRAWMGDLRDFGDWWVGRDELDVDVAQENGQWVLNARSGAKGVQSLDVILPKAAGAKSVELKLGPNQKTRFAFN